MESYFTVELDTTAPVIVDFSSSTLILPEHSIEIEALFNEDISEHRVDITDSKGVLYSTVISPITPRLLSGFIDSSSLAEGMAHLVLTVMDTVRNESTVEADISIISDGLTYCMHDVIKYSPPTISTNAALPKIAVKYSKPSIKTITAKPLIETIKNEPTFKIKYAAPKITTRRCHNI